MAGLIATLDAYTSRPGVDRYAHPESHAIAPSQDSALRRAYAPLAALHPGLSGCALIPGGNEALLYRLALIETAEHSLDAQYYSVQDDMTGKLLLYALLKAADRGVRVRLLVDDITLRKKDPLWTLLNHHPNIELRLFNPFATEDEPYLARLRYLVTKVARFTRRMHNKAFIADNQLSIVGGRNLGDAYFDSSPDFNFRDIDALAAGPVTQEVSADFDRFWNDREAYPFAALRDQALSGEAARKLRQSLAEHWDEEAAKGRLRGLAHLLPTVAHGTLPLVWARAELAGDAPDRIDHKAADNTSAPGGALANLAAGAQHDLVIVSPYFVPEAEGIEWLRALHARGVRVRILTNSLAATDVVAVHAGYRRYREAILAAGAELYEMKPLPGRHPRAGRFASASRASLHTKVYAVDGEHIVLGSMNLDPRSLTLNTEAALVIDSADLAAEVERLFTRAIAPSASYRVTMEDGHLRWRTTEEGHAVFYDWEPKAGFWRRVKVNVLSLLPFENAL